jgi:hypothetical protein
LIPLPFPLGDSFFVAAEPAGVYDRGLQFAFWMDPVCGFLPVAAGCGSGWTVQLSGIHWEDSLSGEAPGFFDH